ncbi:hypothetical protein [Serratia marcescens]|uniref:hypothetical protein n=1 Tax=Serratia marcescens TaxID=615 RepID=UPI001FCA8B1D|nr:hypothetical protein [Serratia marcescens]
MSLQGLAATSRQYGQALTELASITVAATAQMKQLDDAARQASSASGEGGSRAEEMLKLAGGLNDSAAAWRDQAAAARGAAQATSGVARRLASPTSRWVCLAARSVSPSRRDWRCCTSMSKTIGPSIGFGIERCGGRDGRRSQQALQGKARRQN